MKLRLDDCFDFINGGSWNESEYVASGIHVVKVTNLINGSVEYRDDNFLPEEKYEQYKRHKLSEGDVIIATVGSHPTQQGSVVGRTSRVPKEFEGSFLNQNAVCLKNKIPDQVDTRYFFYVSKTVLFKGYIEGRAKGSANQVRMALSDLKKFEHDFPCINTQRKVCAILASYDDLIENNNRKISVLTTIADDTYKEWFYRFRFPEFRNTQFVKGIPKDWSIEKIKNLVTRHKFGKIYREKDLFSAGEIMVVDQSRNELLGFYDGEAEHKATIDDPMILFGDHTCKMVLIHRDFSLAENVIPFKSQGDMPVYFLFHLIKSRAKQTEYKRHWTELVVQQVLVPPLHMQKSFADIVKPIYEEIELLKSQNRNLVTARDAFLPRLISEKLSISNLDIMYPPSMQDFKL